jgi:hypothetical protein
MSVDRRRRRVSYILRAHDWADVGLYPTLGAAQRAAEFHGPRAIGAMGIHVDRMPLSWLEQPEGIWHGVPTVLLTDRFGRSVEPGPPLYTIRAA